MALRFFFFRPLMVNIHLLSQHCSLDKRLARKDTNYIALPKKMDCTVIRIALEELQQLTGWGERKGRIVFLTKFYKQASVCKIGWVQESR